MKKVAMAVAAHPDDIEFLMAGTLVLLKNAGYEIHYMNLSTGNCGSTIHDSEDTTRIRLKEAQNASEVLGATFHPPITNDFEIMYDVGLLRTLAAVIRKVKPSVILTHSPSDYMEDHMNTSRLATTAAFVRGVPNFETGEPAVSNYNCAIYHAVPHGLMDPLRQKVYPEMFIDTTSVQALKRKALQAHQSQQEWLQDSQKMNSYIQAMEDFSLEIGNMSNAFEHAEGWRRHAHYGFSEAGFDPLQTLGHLVLRNEAYAKTA
ncbi:PIG-L family deacetylase [Dyadobacter sp. CY327]|uniref:PIG-L deacetylase family protein n=1 Tax=Dyadobacter sp. CY327 TaxID=2907301 RepID=UPI001F25E1DC|nr:PIG-L deacetylase family protein [Dyadobacter sp. CY327]MCE7070826.1 PIG-L family deacetylase [Dyadobacter sp. CY327]